MKFDTNNVYYVYARRRKDNDEIFYIGKGRDDRYLIFKRNIYHDRVAKKYGYYTEIIKDNLTEIEALELEKELIDKYWGKKLTNIVKDSVQSTNTLEFHPNKDEIFKKIGLRISETWNNKSDEEKIAFKLRCVPKWKETWNNKSDEEISEWKRKLSEKHYGKVIPNHVRLKIKESMMGELNHFYGKTHSDETKNKLSQAAKARWEDPEYKAKMIESFRNIDYTPELREKLKVNAKKANYARYSIMENREKQSRAISGTKNGRAMFYKCTLNNKIYFGLTLKNIQSDVINIFNSHFNSNYYPSMVIKGILYILNKNSKISKTMKNIIDSKPQLFVISTREEYLNQ